MRGLTVDGRRAWVAVLALFLGFAAHARVTAAEPDGRLTADEIRQWGWDQEIVRPDGLKISWAMKAPLAVNAGWLTPGKFPEHAVSLRTPKEIAEVYAASLKAGSKEPAFVTYPRPADVSLRIVGTGHSFMMPGYGTLPSIASAAGLKEQRLYVHGGGGVTGSARYKWEEENGIYQFDKKPKPKLLASIANGQWDVMMWGPFFQDRPAYYECWIDFCLKYNPQMKFYLVDVWPGIAGLSKAPATEAELSDEALGQWFGIPKETFSRIVAALEKKYPGKVFLVPMNDAMHLAAKRQREGKLPGIEGVHKLIGKKERSLFVDPIGHLGPAFNLLEGYVFYATLYGKSPEQIPGTLAKEGQFPSKELDLAFRQIAWEAVSGNAPSGVKEK